MFSYSKLKEGDYFYQWHRGMYAVFCHHITENGGTSDDFIESFPFAKDAAILAKKLNNQKNQQTNERIQK